MRFFHLWWFSGVFVAPFSIKMTTESPLCSQCIHFIPMSLDSLNKPVATGECRRFGGYENVLTGGITYLDATECRQDDDICGPEGYYFTPSESPIESRHADIEEQMAKTRLSLFVCQAVLHTVLWIGCGELLYLHLWVK